MAIKRNLYIYSHGAIPALTNLWDSIYRITGTLIPLDDAFYIGVWCDPTLYARYDWSKDHYLGEIPSILTMPETPDAERLDFVNAKIQSVTRGEEAKPDWMFHIEEATLSEGCCCGANITPSTYLTLIPKDDQYAELGKALIEFLYSANLLTTL